MIKYYYYDMLKQFREGMPGNDTLYPSISKLEEAVQFKNNPTFKRMLANQDASSNYLQSCTNRNGLLYQYYNSEDME
jgi:hypothetical protein